MSMSGGHAWSRMAAGIPACLRRPELLSFLPALTLAAFWLGGERWLIATALGVPVLFAVQGAFRPSPGHGLEQGRDAVTGLVLRTGFVAALDTILAGARHSGRTTACLVVRLDDPGQVQMHHGHAAYAEMLRRSADRVRDALREADCLAWLDGAGFAIALSPVRRADLESVLALAARLQQSVSAPISIDGARLFVTASVGFCLPGRAPAGHAEALLEAAEIAADDAMQNGPGAIRAFTPEVHRTRADRSQMRDALEAALDEGQIVAYFQPQICTDTGEISGVEALARWIHPARQTVAPAGFMQDIEAAGLSERLSEVMLFNALSALNRWDSEGLKVGRIGVNFARSELHNPQLVEKVRWELDRFDLEPGRLAVEVLETVIADSENDIVVRNICALAAMGCTIDLDDFGTGHASITNIRRFSVNRVKIDRSLVTHVDVDRDQQRMVSAILSMSDRLGLETLAEGVETAGEHAMLAQLGCGHVQGFVLARPMSFDDASAWIARHNRKRAQPPRIGRSAR